MHINLNDVGNQYNQIQDTLRHARIMHDVFKEPVMNDMRYDYLVKEALEIEKKYPEQIIKKPVARSIKDQVLSLHNPAKHDYPMLRLNHKHDLSGLINWLKTIQTRATVNIHVKNCGVALELIYIEGKLHKAITKGDGLIGRDVTVNAYCIKSIPESIKDAPGRTCIRGVVSSETIRVNSNGVATTMHGLDLKAHVTTNLIKQNPDEEYNDLVFVAHTVTNPNLTHSTWADWSTFLRSRGFTTPKCYGCNLKAGIYEPGHWEDILDHIKERILNSAYLPPFDGLVFSVAEMEHRYELGYTSRFPEWAIAFTPDKGFTNAPTETTSRTVSTD